MERSPQILAVSIPLLLAHLGTNTHTRTHTLPLGLSGRQTEAGKPSFICHQLAEIDLSSRAACALSPGWGYQERELSEDVHSVQPTFCFYKV